jgi:hypothetical protein
MPLYYFIVDPDPRPDNEGVELPDIEAAWQEATKTAGELVKDLDGSFQVGSEWSVQPGC